MTDAPAPSPLRVTVDLTPLLPGGQNGGVKPFIFEYLGWLGRQTVHPVRFTFLTRRLSHADVRSLARPGDALVCVMDSPEGAAIRSDSHSPAERTWFNPPADLLLRISTDVLYLPFGYFQFHCPGIPTVATVVDVLHRDYPRTLGRENVGQREAVFQDITRRADFVQAISHFTETQFAQHYGFPRERLFCSYIAIHGRLMHRAARETASAAASPYFLYPANAWEHKNHKVLLLAYGIYRHRTGSAAWDLVLTGHDDQEMRSVLDLARVLGVGDHVRFLGHVRDTEFTRVWRDAGALVFPSLYEGFGIPLTEAMGFGIPIISSRCGSLAEIGGDACLYVDALKPADLANAMVSLAQDPALADTLRRKGFTRLSEFSFESDARVFLEKLLACAAIRPRALAVGVHPDGWTEPFAVLPVPDWGRPARLTISLRQLPVARTLLIRHGGHPAGTYRIPDHSPMQIEIPIMADGRLVSLSVPDASHLSQSDHRCHGICLESVSLHDTAGTQADLLKGST